MATIEKMTVEELQRLIDERINEQISLFLGRFDVNEDELFVDKDKDSRTWEQVKQDIERDRWTPPSGAKSSLELLREDRDN